MYDVKIVNCGNVLEIYKYDNPISEGFKIKPFERKRREQTEEVKNENLQRSIKRSKRKIFELVNTNYVKNKSSFLTLTFADNITDYYVAFDCWKRYKQRLEYHFNRKLQYCGVVEFQTKNYSTTGRCAIHFHIVLFDVPYLKHNVLYDIWNMTVSNGGSVNIKQIKHVDNVGAYITSYMTEDIKERDEIFSDKFKGKKRYFYSRGLKKPSVTKLDLSKYNDFEQYYNLINTDRVKNNVVFEYESKFERKEFNTYEYTDIETGEIKKRAIENILYSQKLEYKQITLEQNREFRKNVKLSS